MNNHPVVSCPGAGTLPAGFSSDPPRGYCPLCREWVSYQLDGDFLRISSHMRTLPRQESENTEDMAEDQLWLARPCPQDCGCSYPSDPDGRDCGCDGPCTMDREWFPDISDSLRIKELIAEVAYLQGEGRSLGAWQEIVGAWGDATFRQTPQSVLAHLKDEIEELRKESNPTKRQGECADVLSLMFNLAHTEGWSLQDAFARKFAINQARAWQKNDRGFHEHIPGDNEL